MVQAAATSPAPNWQSAVEQTVAGMGYELVDCERAPAGLLRVYIDRLPGQNYLTGPGEAVTVDDCEVVTRQLQYALEVAACDYARLEVSSPGLDRPLRKAADYQRFSGLEVEITLRQPFQGRKKYRGILRAEAEPWELIFNDGKQDQALQFALDEVRDARLVPVIDFKGRGRKPQQEPAVEGHKE
jgi:ribosome maturation factor RimP